MRSRRITSLSMGLALLLLTAAFFTTCAQDIPVRPVHAQKRAAIVEAVIKKLNDYYIDPEVAGKIEELVRKKLVGGEYDNLDRLHPFVRQLTADLRNVSNDQHLGVWPIEYAILTERTSDEERLRLEARSRYANYGLNNVKRLPGNIGYLELMYFADPNMAGATAVAAMNFLANSDALIVDVRRNGGGEGYLVRLIQSYFFKNPVHLNDIYSRIDDSTEQSWTLPYVPGPRLAEIPIYVLQSRRTASAAEAFAYALKAQGRVTLVGEKTKGAANPVEEFSLPELSICMAVSAYRVTNPITGTCWEGVGVEPDLAVDAELALYAAAAQAIKKLMESSVAGQEIDCGRRWALELYEARLNQVALTSEEQEQYAGRYGDSYLVRVSSGTLMLERPRAMPLTLIPLGKDAFATEEEEGKVQFKRDDSGTVVEMEILDCIFSKSVLKKQKGN